MVKGSYVIVLSAVVLVVGYVMGIAQGRSNESDGWRAAVMRVPDDGCRDAVRDALRLMQFE